MTNKNIFAEIDAIDTTITFDRPTRKVKITPQEIEAAVLPLIPQEKIGALSLEELEVCFEKIGRRAEALATQIDYVRQNSGFPRVHPVSVSLQHMANAVSNLILRTGDANQAVDIEIDPDMFVDTTEYVIQPDAEQYWDGEGDENE